MERKSRRLSILAIGKARAFTCYHLTQITLQLTTAPSCAVKKQVFRKTSYVLKPEKHTNEFSKNPILVGEEEVVPPLRL